MKNKTSNIHNLILSATTNPQAIQTIEKMGWKAVPELLRILEGNDRYCRDISLGILRKLLHRKIQLSSLNSHTQDIQQKLFTMSDDKNTHREILEFIRDNLPTQTPQDNLFERYLICGGTFTIEIGSYTIHIKRVPFLRSLHKSISQMKQNPKLHKTFMPLPQIILLWPLIFIAFACGATQIFAPQYSSIIAKVFTTAFALNITALTFRVTKAKYLLGLFTCILLFSMMLFSYMPKIYAGNTIYFAISGGLLSVTALAIFVNYLWNRWTISAKRIYHKHGLFADVKEYPGFDLLQPPTKPTTKVEPSIVYPQVDQIIPEVTKEKEKKPTPPKSATSILHQQHIPRFEKWLDEDAMQPGVVERSVAQFRWLMKSLQVTIGLKFILIANICDRIIDFIASYITSIFQAWQTTKMIRKKWKRRKNNNEWQELCDDFTLSRLQLSRLFSFRGFTIEKWNNALPNSAKWNVATQASFPLQLVMETRSHLSDVKRDLQLLTTKQGTQFAQKTLMNWLLSFIPNPLDFLGSVKDFLIVAFVMNYSRDEIQKMYTDLVTTHQQLLTLLKNHQNAQQIVPLFDYEQPKNITTIHDIEKCIDQNRFCLQRFIQLLANPQSFIYPQCWTRQDLIKEVKNTQGKPHVNLLYQLELEYWLRKKIRVFLPRQSLKEKELQWQEMKEWRRKFKLMRRLKMQFLL